MKIVYSLLICLTLTQPVSTYTSSMFTTFSTECIDTFKAGLPGALLSAVLWRIAYDVPHTWPDVTQPTASFIKKTWKDQGFLEADSVILKQIPADSFMAKVVVYTQEFPGALAVGLPFIRRVEKLLAQQEEIAQKLTCVDDATRRSLLEQERIIIEEELDECRFVCGHERVHQEQGHAYKILITQCIAPFAVYIAAKQSAKLLRHYNILPWMAPCLEWKATRSAAEIGIFWITAHLYEREADLHASTNPKVIKAGINLFKRAQNQKVPEMGPVGYRTKMMAWLLKYTHPVLSERIWYLTMALRKFTPQTKVASDL